jgi:hypothetical protein
MKRIPKEQSRIDNPKKPTIYGTQDEENTIFVNRISAVFQKYFIIKYNVFNKYIINVTTTEINTSKKIIEFGQREVISFFTLVTNKHRKKYKIAKFPYLVLSPVLDSI